MRLTSVVLPLTLTLAAARLHAQDPGAMAAQQASMAAQQASQQATQQALADTQQASQNAQQQMQMAQSWGNDASPRPKFSVKRGTYAAPVTVSIKAYRNSAIFYTLDGSKPTAKSTPYMGAITVPSTTTISAIAILPRYYPSAVARAAYVITPPKP